MSALPLPRDAVAGALVMRVTTFRPVDVWHDLDRRLRDMAALFAAQEGVVDAWFGRSGQGTGEERVVVSTWASHLTQSLAPTLPGLDGVADRGPLLADVRTDVLDVRIREQFVRPDPMRLLRLYRGTTRPGELEDYLLEARVGVTRDGGHPYGPGALVCGTYGDDRFVTASLWDAWESIERATGGDIHHPLATRNVARLAGGGPAHFESIGCWTTPPSRPTRRGTRWGRPKSRSEASPSPLRRGPWRARPRPPSGSPGAC